MQQTFYGAALGRALRPGKGSGISTGQLFGDAGAPSVLSQGTGKSAAGISGRDSFELAKNISELLSPSCGMTEEQKQAYLAHILAKLKSGKRLSAEELRFLQSENPVLYQQAARVQAMRDSLETRLKNCTSKAEVSDVFSQAMSMIPDEDPMKEYITAAYQDAMDEFQKSDRYQDLPQEDDKKLPRK